MRIIEHELVICKSIERVKKLDELLVESRREGKRLDQVERDLFAFFLEWGLKSLEEFVEASGNGDEGETVERDGRVLQRLEKPHKRPYRSIFGVLEIERTAYGTREGQAIEFVPLDGQLGLPEGEQSYVLEDWLGRLFVKEPYRESVQSLRDLLRIKTTVGSAERTAMRMEAHVASYRESQPQPSAKRKPRSW